MAHEAALQRSTRVMKSRLIQYISMLKSKHSDET